MCLISQNYLSVEGACGIFVPQYTRSKFARIFSSFHTIKTSVVFCKFYTLCCSYINWSQHLNFSSKVLLLSQMSLNNFDHPVLKLSFGTLNRCCGLQHPTLPTSIRANKGHPKLLRLFSTSHSLFISRSS